MKEIMQRKEMLSQRECLLKIIITRHGPKESATGEKDNRANYFDESIKNGIKEMPIDKETTGLMHISSSNIDRAIVSAEIITQQIQKTTEYRLGRTDKQKTSLATPFRPKEDGILEQFSNDLETIVALQKKFEDKIRKEIMAESKNLDDIEKEAELRNRLDMVVLTMMFNDQDNEIFETKWEDLADIFAKRYFGFAKHRSILKKLKNDNESNQPKGEPYVQIDVTHSFPITLFLKKYLIFNDGEKAIDLQPKEFFEKTGGIIREAGNFEMNYIEDEKGKLSIVVKGEFTKGKKFKGIIDLQSN